MERLAVTGASGKTGWRVVDEALQRGMAVRVIARPASVLPQPLAEAEREGRLEVQRVELSAAKALQQALKGCTALVIATGARPSVNLAAPLQVDAIGVQAQVKACKAVGLKRVILVSSLCAGRWLHPLNLFGLILVWKRLGERSLQNSTLDWTVIRPGGLSEDDSRADNEGILFSGADEQESNSIPRRLVAQVCMDALLQPNASGRIIEITSSNDLPQHNLSTWLQSQTA